jgi:hypothetical protein
MMALVVVASLVLAGCMQSNYYSYSTGGMNPANVSDTFSAPSGKGAVQVSTGGMGSATVTIKDADGKQIFRETFSGAGGSSNSKTIEGQPGTWSIDIRFSNWQGGFSINVVGA